MASLKTVIGERVCNMSLQDACKFYRHLLFAVSLFSTGRLTQVYVHVFQESVLKELEKQKWIFDSKGEVVTRVMKEPFAEPKEDEHKSSDAEKVLTPST